MGFFPSGFPLTWWTLVLHILSHAYSPQVGRHRQPRHGRGSGPQEGQPLRDHYGCLPRVTSTGRGPPQWGSVERSLSLSPSDLSLAT